MSPLLWISRSLEHVTEALRRIGYALSTFVVRWTLKSLGYRLRPGNALWRLQHHPKQRLGQRRNQFRHRALRGEHAAAVVVELRRTGVRGHARSLGECGWRGSNGSSVRLWKMSLQEFANEINIPITVCHYPPDTSKMEPHRT